MSTKRKFNSKLGQPAVKPSAKPATKESLNDSRAVISKGGVPDHTGMIGSQDIVEISSDSDRSSEDEEEEEEEDEEDDDDDEEEDDDNDDNETGEHGAQPTSKMPTDNDVDMKDAGDQAASSQIADETEGPTEPSFGDLVLANSLEPVDVAGVFHDSNFNTLSYPQSNKLQPPSGASLGTVLTQALKTNDLTLLESCLQTPDAPTIRATIQRLDSPLAGTLLQKLAERLHRRPGRAGSLMVWVQWTLVTHGGYLATQPDLIKKLAELNRVIDERARSLQSLLSLKGKLDMLEAQMQLRQSMRRQRHDSEDEDDEAGVIYVEGEDEDSSSGDTDQEENLTNGTKAKNNSRQEPGNSTFSADEDEVSEDMPTTANGVIDDSDEDVDDSDNFIDDEAEETDAESDDEDDVDHSDIDEMEDDDDSDDAAPVRAAAALPPAKMQKVGGLFSRSRQ